MRIIPARAGFTAQHDPVPVGAGDHPRSRGVYATRLASESSGSGSSPLARGLQVPGVPGGRRRGIIPARAGFTGMGRGAPRRPGDHPRSRGVYRRHPIRPGRLPRIIPARAGFTFVRSRASRSSRDHPRSRGVYYPWADLMDYVVGSSPLARGLHDVVAALGAYMRIIPARAGFTTDPTSRLAPGEDHPRSRGVYWSGPRRSASWCGSSPLARGLRSRSWSAESHPRIIPARAGFTCAGSRTTWTRSDHPRSRGVYLPVITAGAVILGSSPLARGLRGHQARAAVQRPDHPRSRGVYWIAMETAGVKWGSSPLARGLRAYAPQYITPIRIIPARAGFTGEAPAAPDQRRDHPRSRGVYPPATGSTTRCPRIIPARAGFTTCPVRGPQGTTDHPRSRGVYKRGRIIMQVYAGSSPLARGLPPGRTRRRPGAGIIPARAGFTHDRQQHPHRREDHPRSRGVYTCGSLESQRTRTLPDPCCLHCRPRARSAELR